MVCQRLWRERLSLSNTISAEDLEVLGDVDAALTDFYVNAIRETANQTGICEGDLRRWFEEK